MGRIFQAVASLIACTLSVPNPKVGLGKNLTLFPDNEYVHKCRIRQKERNSINQQNYELRVDDSSRNGEQARTGKKANKL